MKEIRDALLRMIKAGTKTREMMEHYQEIGMDDSELFEIYGDILDGIYYLIGEHTNMFSDSVTYLVMNTKDLPEGQRLSKLMDEYEKNHPEQPKPNTIEQDEMERTYKMVGGYLYETPEGDWMQDKSATDKINRNIEYLKKELTSAGNELCYKCGGYKREHEGVCDGCKWRYLKYGGMPE